MTMDRVREKMHLLILREMKEKKLGMRNESQKRHDPGNKRVYEGSVRRKEKRLKNKK